MRASAIRSIEVGIKVRFMVDIHKSILNSVYFSIDCIDL